MDVSVSCNNGTEWGSFWKISHGFLLDVVIPIKEAFHLDIPFPLAHQQK